jgi:pimeloyl-ACP methyl ester carboxylesterase
MRTTRLQVGGDEVVVHDSAGPGRALVLLHGHWDAKLAFSRQLEGPLGKEFRVVAIDLPGEGAAAPAADPAATYSMPGLARAFTAAVDSIGLSDAVMAGWSLGGHILIEAIPLLNQASAFCLFGTPPLKFPPNMDEAFLPHAVMRLLFQERLTDDEFQEWAESISPSTSWPSGLVGAMKRADARKRSSILESIARVGYADECDILAQVGKPVAVLHGERDALVPKSYLASVPIPTLWRGTVQVIPDASHAAHWDSTADFDSLVATFLSE